VNCYAEEKKFELFLLIGNKKEESFKLLIASMSVI